jgi:hypothetical protein
VWRYRVDAGGHTGKGQKCAPSGGGRR